MVIDTSALIAILRNEPERAQFIAAIDSVDKRNMSAVSFVETAMIIESRYGPRGILELDMLVSKATINIRSVDLSQAIIARNAFHNFGKGRHPAGLNFGDCFTYALAKMLNEPLLFKGEDFSKTDIRIFFDRSNATN